MAEHEKKRRDAGHSSNQKPCLSLQPLADDAGALLAIIRPGLSAKRIVGDIVEFDGGAGRHRGGD